MSLTSCERQPPLRSVPPPPPVPAVQDTRQSSSSSAASVAQTEVRAVPDAVAIQSPRTETAAPVARTEPVNPPPAVVAEPEPVAPPPPVAVKPITEKSAGTAAEPRPDARDIVKKSDDLIRGDTAQGTYIMEITTPSWTRTLELSVFSKGRDRVFIRILSPAKEAGTGTLRIDNEMWNYLPRIEKVIKIPPSLMLQSWMGSDFANDDLVKENSIVEDYTHRIVAEETLNGHATYKIELIPKSGAAVIWGRLDYWIRRADYVPIRQDFYDERGRLVKRLDYSDIEQVSDRTVPRTWMMTNLLKEGKSTRIYLKDVVYNQPIDDNIFTLSNLKRLK